MFQELFTQQYNPKRDFYCAPSVGVYAPPGALVDDREYHQAKFLGSVYCEKFDVPFVQYPPHLHFGHDLITITSGTCQVLIEESDTITLTPGSLLIVPGGNSHRRIVNDGACCCGIELSPDYFFDYLSAPRIDGVALGLTQRVIEVHGDTATRIGVPLPVHFVYDHKVSRSFLNLFEECLTAYNQITPLRAHIIYTFGSVFAQFLLGLLTQPRVTEQSTAQRVLDVKRWLDRHYADDISIPRLAEKANLSPHWFSSLFHKIVGLPPKAYLISLRIKHAAYLLVETDYTVTDIMYRVGYNDLANFVRAFESHYTTTPQSYRHKHKPLEK
jgi:AraC-like DNA-binding protein